MHPALLLPNHPDGPFAFFPIRGRATTRDVLRTRGNDER